MPSPIVAVTLEARYEELVKGLQRANAAVIEFAKGVQNQAGGTIVPANARAEKSAEGMMGKFQAWRMEQVQQGRQARFLAAEFTSIIPAAGGATEAVRGLAEVFIEGAAGGLGFGVAMAATKLVVGTIAEHFAHAAKEAEKTSEALKTLSSQAEELRTKRLGLGAEVASEGRLEVALKLVKELGEAQDRVHIANLDNDIEEMKTWGAILTAKKAATKEAEKSLGIGEGDLPKWIEGQRILLEEQRKSAQVRRDATDQEEVARGRLLAAYTEEGKIRAQYANAIAAAQLKLDHGEIDYFQWVQAANNALRERNNLLEAILNKQQAAALIAQSEQRSSVAAFHSLEAAAGGPAAPASTMPSDSRDAGTYRYFSAQDTAASFSQAEIDMAGTKDQRQAATEAYRQQLADVQALVQPFQAASKQLGDALVDGFADGFKNMQGVWNGILKSFAKFLLDLGIKAAAGWLTTHLLQKPTKAAEVVADSGIVGAGTAAALASNPVTALGAIPAGVAAMEAAQAAFLPVAIAERGWDLPSFGGPFPALLHPKEMVLPPPIAERFRDGIGDGGGGGAITVHLTIPALDGPSVHRVVQGDEFLNAVGRAIRSGRWPR